MSEPYTEIRLRVDPANLDKLIREGDLVERIWLEDEGDGTYSLCSLGPKTPGWHKRGPEPSPPEEDPR